MLHVCCARAEATASSRICALRTTLRLAARRADLMLRMVDRVADDCMRRRKTARPMDSLAAGPKAILEAHR
jgi:hypothetical protein